MEPQCDHDRSEPSFRAKPALDQVSHITKSDSLEFTAMRLDSLPSILRLPRHRGLDRSRPYTPSTASSSDASGKGEARLEQTNRAASLQKTANLAPFVTAQTWAVTDGKTGALLWGSMEFERREIASLTKVMTCYLSLQLLHSIASLHVDTIIPVSYSAASLIGTSARLREGDELHLLDALYGLMLPSGNDAAYCLAEFFGRVIHERDNESGAATRSYVSYFVREMNRTAKDLGLENTNYSNPHGLPNIKNRSTARDVGLLASIALRDPIFAEIVNTQSYSCYVMQDSQVYPYRKVKWSNTNRLLDRGWDGVKTGITNVAGPCLCASSRKNGVHIIVTVLGSKSMDRRWVEVPKLGKWAFGKLGVEVKTCESVNRL